MLAFSLSMLLPVAASAQTIVSIEFDDGIANQYQARSVLSAHGMHGTFFVNTGMIGLNSNWLSWQQLTDLQGDGNEIADHGVQHLSLAQASQLEQQREICMDRSNLAAHGFQATDYAYPYGRYTALTQSIAKGCGLNSARTVGGLDSPYCCVEAESTPPADPYATRSVVLTSSDTLASMESYVTSAESAGGWVQLVFHNLCTGCDAYGVTPANFTSLLDWLRTRAAQGTVVKTVHEVIGGAVQPVVQAPPPPPVGTGANMLANPSLETTAGSAPECWTPFSFGNNSSTFSSTSSAHSGSIAEQVNVTGYVDGAARLMITRDLGDCSPTVTPGHTYVISAWYQSTAPVYFAAYYRTTTGVWKSWQGSPTFPASNGWSHATFTTPAVPADGEAISFGLSLATNGTLTTDDYGMADSTQTISVATSAPAGGTGVSGAAVQLSATASSASGIDHVDFLINGQVVGTSRSAPYTISWDSTKVPDGPVSYTVHAVDLAGHTADSPVTLLTVDNTPPSTSIACNAAPCATAAYANAPVSVTLAATDAGSGVAALRYTTDGSTPTLSSAAYSGAIKLYRSATVQYRAWDNAGNMSAVGRQTVSVTPPVVTVTAPSSGTIVNSTVTFTVAVTGITPSKVRYYADGGWIGFSASSPFSLTWDPYGSNGVTKGVHQITAVAYDAVGNATSSAPIQITVQ